MAREPRDHALLVGIQDYPHYRPLEGPFDDVTAVEEWLLDQPGGGGLDAGHVACVRSRPQPIQPVQRQIDEALNGLFEAAERAGGGRRLYVYFSGHGIGSRHDEVNLCLAGWSLRFRNDAIRSSEYSELVRDSGLFHEVVFLLDCCRVRKVGAPGQGPLLGFPQPNGRPSRVFTGFATEYQNAAYESLSARDDLDDSPAPRGYFTAAFLNAVWGAAAQEAGGVRASALKEYLEIQTPRLAAEDGHVQQPEVTNGLPTGAAEPIFGLCRPSIGVEIAFRPGRRGAVTLLGPDCEVIREGRIETGPWRLDLAPGLYALRGDEEDSSYFRLNRPKEANRVEF